MRKPKSMDELKRDKQEKDYLKVKSKYVHYKKLGHKWATVKYKKKMSWLEKVLGK